MREYKPLRWPRFWPFLRIKDEMPSHRINVTENFVWWGFLLPSFFLGAWWLTLFLGAAYVTCAIWGPFRFLPAPPRKASNYGVSIVIRRDVLESESWVLSQEIYESRYWLAHSWRLVDFVWFHCYRGNYWSPGWWQHKRYKRFKQAAAHLASVECASRAQEIRARNHKTHEDWMGLARDYARSIHGAKNYPWFSAAGWTEERVYQEIVRHL